ncbi:GH1 family beta-glucosidase [Micromonospora yangpuensis]|uniref:Beta-glucosidase n=1 Tax=Micromonospora yangpuensis TaxID=683228 RepID=A0A1C6V248_9ACTN|nr:GH1 family beta-glucosidase [Micromonospora yangpuensis]GGL98221.1 beta-glucosidase [Micromonospora yangpuensis]SCL60356.1 beta-glucosidase [Micromonospora yangpuensis]
MTAPMPTFPAGFRWGVSTSAYQIEGAATADGRGRSIWDTFAHTPGRIADGSTGDVACDHYHRHREDVALLAGLGVSAYRFSVAWPRVLPTGSGAVVPAGLDFYERLVDDLLAAGIDPVATLFHWDLPQPLQDRGGWLARDTASHFAEYADAVAARLGDRVKLWITLNEPFIHLSLGHGTGAHAPGQALLLDALPVAHHQLLGHGLAVAALRARSTAPVAIANNYSPVVPAGRTDADRAAAAAYHALHNRLCTDPLLGRGYPPGFDPTEVPTGTPAVVRDGDLDVIAAPLDVLGVNYYHPSAVRAGTPDDPLPFELVPLTGHPRTAFDWPVVPDGLRDLLVGLRTEYGDALPPIQVTENGCAYDDVPDTRGRVHDPERIAYLDGHLRAVHAAIAAGVEVTGYFVWSLLDNWEWAEGFTKRFGLTHVDFATQRRTPKSSYTWFRDVVTRPTPDQPA